MQIYAEDLKSEGMRELSVCETFRGTLVPPTFKPLNP
jgi:hypothetical protein